MVVREENSMYTFPIVEKHLNSIKNIEHIHPRKQRIVEKILKEVPVISIFGSATRWDCNEKSDIDLLLNINDISMNKEEVFNKLARIVDSNFDILWEDEIKNSLNKHQEDNIINRSVKLYER